MLLFTSSTDVIEEGVVIFCTQKGAWEHHRVEWHIVFGHKLVELNFLGVLPPLLPVLRVAGCDGQVPTMEGSNTHA